MILNLIFFILIFNSINYPEFDYPAFSQNSNPIYNHSISNHSEYSEYKLFENWLLKDHVSNYTYRGIKDYNNFSYNGSYVCVHFARDLIENAKSANYTIYPAYLTSENRPLAHMMNLIFLDDHMYIIEPQTDAIIPIEEVYNQTGYEKLKWGKKIVFYDNNRNARVSEDVSVLKLSP